MPPLNFMTATRCWLRASSECRVVISGVRQFHRKSSLAAMLAPPPPVPPPAGFILTAVAAAPPPLPPKSFGAPRIFEIGFDMALPVLERPSGGTGDFLGHT